MNQFTYSPEEVFTSIAKANSWGSKESVSGPGSTLAATRSLRRVLPKVLYRFDILSLVDAPCGDMNWMSHLDYRFQKFIGVDIVPVIIDPLREMFLPEPNYHFQTGNIVTDILPRADAVLCRDCLVHLPNAAVLEALKRFRLAGFKFLIATTFTRRMENPDINFGEWRPINLQAEPFNLDEPIDRIPDNDGFGEDFNDKMLGVWAL